MFLETLRVALPVIIGQIGLVLFGVIDNAMVGRLGAVDLAASSFVNNLFSIPLVFAVGVGSAISVHVANAYGAGNSDKVGHILRSGQKALIMISIIIVAGFLLGMPFLHLLKQPPEVLEASKGFYLLIVVSLIPQVAFISFKQAVDGLSKTVPPTVITYVGLLINVLLNWLLIYGNAGAPKLGLLGAGVATLTARIVMAIAIGVYVLKTPALQMYFKNWRKGVFETSQILKVGLPSGFTYLFEVGAFAGAGVLMGVLGSKVLAAHQISISMAALTFMFALGLSIAASILVGQAIGAGNMKTAIKIGRQTLAFVVLIEIGFGIFFILFRHQLPHLFIEDPEVIALSSRLLLITAVFQIFDGVQCVAIGILRGFQDVRVPTLLTFVSYWIIALPIAYILGFHLEMGGVGVWISLAVGLGCAAMSLSYRVLIKKDSISASTLDPKVLRA